MKYLLLSIYCFTLSVLTLQAKDSPQISGNIVGFDNDTLVAFCVSVSNGSVRALDTLVAKNGSFELYLDVPEATECALYSSKSYIIRANGKRYLPETSIIKVMLFPDSKVTVTGIKKPLMVDYQVTGNIFNEELSKRRSSTLQLKTAFVKEDLMLDSLAFKKTNRKTLDQMDALLTIRKDSAKLTDIQYIKDKPNTDLAAYYVLSMAQDSFLKYITVLQPAVRTGFLKQKLDLLEANYLSVHSIQQALKTVVVGSKAPNFSLQSMGNTTVQLSDFKGKYIVLDFWGSSFHWCIQAIPQMKKYYEKYKNDVEFIGINVRDSETEWKSTVHKYGLNWIQLRNLTSLDVPVLYGVSAYPTRFILDSKFTIVARMVGEDPAFYKALDDLLSAR